MSQDHGPAPSVGDPGATPEVNHPAPDGALVAAPTSPSPPAPAGPRPLEAPQSAPGNPPATTPAAPSPVAEPLLTDYKQTALYFMELHSTRFKLLALLPVASGAAIGLLQRASPIHEMAIGALGVLVTIGLFIYDQRNTHIYDRLVRRCQFLEVTMQLEALPQGGLLGGGGAFSDRPKRRPILTLHLIWHDLGLAIVYAGSLGAWTFLTADGFNKDSVTRGVPPDRVVWLWVFPVISALIAFWAGWKLARVNDAENTVIDTAIDSLRCKNIKK